MQFRNKLNAFCVVALVGLVLAPTMASAVTIQYVLDTSVAGQFKVFAQTKAGSGDHGGLVTFGIPLTGADTIENMAPFSLFATGPTGGGTAGFSELRSGANASPVAGGQNIIAPTPNLIYGFAQESSSFEAKGITAVSPANVPSWEAKLLLAQGTHSGSIAIDTTNVNFLADVFTANGTPTIVAAEVEACLNSCGPPVGIAPAIQAIALGDTNLAIINQQLNATGDTPITWSNLVASTGSPNVAATLSPTGAFQWHTIGSALGNYAWTATATNAAGTDTDVALTLTLTIPEPATLSMIGLAMVGFVGFVGRRSR